jgi:hypothetical protein
MKTLTSLILLLFITLNSYSIPVKTPPLTVASIDTNYRITVPSIPIQRYYYVDISHLCFDSEEEAIRILEFYLTANLITPVIHYKEGYLIIQILIEYIPDVADYEGLQFYLDHLTKPTN